MKCTLSRQLACSLMVVSAALVLGCGSSTAPAPAANSAAEPHAAAERGVQAAAVSASDSEGGVRTVAYAEAAIPENQTAQRAEKPAADALPRQKYFEGWPKPKLAIVISGRQDGYLEPCGCAGLENQKGGLSRRFALIKDLEKRGWPLAAVDVGGLVRRYGKQAEVQFGTSVEALKKMNYSAVGFGGADLRLSATDVAAVIAGATPDDSIFVSANVDVLGFNPKVRIVEAGGLKVGITSVLGEAFQAQVNNQEIEIKPAAEALREVVDQLKGCHVRILLAHATAAESRELAKQFPQFQLVVTADGADEPPAQPEIIKHGKKDSSSRLIEVGHKGMYVIVAGLFDDPKHSVRFERVALDSRFPDSSEMKQLMAAYQDQLQQLGWEGLGIKESPHPKAEKGDKLAGQFASAASCKECHPTAWGIWSKTKHAHATETLAKLDIPRLHDAECVSCHVTGWNPQGYFPFTSGFESLETTPELAGNSCENCHGPGAAHVAAEKGRNAARRTTERDAMKLTTGFAEKNVCTKCHDLDNSPNYIKEGFDKYWPKVEHKGKH